jgi:septal ring factor EnvC (AmiA/AmiB activator)
MQARWLFLFPVFAVIQGCEADRSEEVANLQKQVAALTRQVEETRKEITTLKETQQQTHRSLSVLEEEFNHVKQRELPPPTRTTKPSVEPADPQEPASRRTGKVACAQVWKLLGQGKDEATAARMLETTVEVVRACEQGVGRGDRRG